MSDNMERCDIYIYKSPVGFLRLMANSKCLKCISFIDDWVINNYESNNKHLLMTIKQLDEYFAGNRRSFHISREFQNCSGFHRSVWKSLCNIPYGETRSYKDIAIIIGNPLACRAVGNACKSNPYPLIVPCHRVISSSGSLGGFSPNIYIKEKLLDFEKQITHNFRNGHLESLMIY